MLRKKSSSGIDVGHNALRFKGEGGLRAASLITPAVSAAVAAASSANAKVILRGRLKFGEKAMCTPYLMTTKLNKYC